MHGSREGNDTPGASDEVLPQGSQPATGSRSGERIRVLLVDDSKIVQEGLARLLRGEPDIEIVGEAFDGEKAIDLTRRFRPDVMTMDINLPGMSGIQATRAIHAEFPEVRVIGLSIFEEGEMADSMRAAGAVGYVAKSAPASALLAAIRAAMKTFRGE
jgi:DNA-binding NarL/FixJ family response regulator